ncbi:MAG: hypothetical protein LBL32_01585 [Holosporales bacterium]|nr:hypothetical protein [Holosporales bacterium]
MLNILLKKEWVSIVGMDLCDVSEFVEAKFVGKGSIDVHCCIVGSASIQARGLEKDIAERVRTLTSSQNVRIFFKQCSSIPGRKAKLAMLSFDNNPDLEVVERSYSIDVPIRNDKLRAALVSLGGAIQDAA